MSKPRESNPAESLPPARLEDPALLHERLAARDAACAELSSLQVKLASVVEAQATAIAGLKEELARAHESLERRHAEIAKLTGWLADEEAGSRAAQRELARVAGEGADARQRLAKERAAAGHRAVLLEHAAAAAREASRTLGDSLEQHRRHGESCMAEIRRFRDRRSSRFLARLGWTMPAIPPPPATEDPGTLEERDVAIVRTCDLFDAAWYKARHPGVDWAAQDPVLHYLREGAAAGFAPGPDFDGVAYLAQHRDVRRSGMNPLVHYAAFGRAEGRAMRAVVAGAG